jgi:aspartate kinase
MLKVVKFGGSSLSDATQVKKVFNIVTSDPSRKFVVVSAPGKRNSSDTKVTDMLIKLAEKALAYEDVTHQLNLILQRFQDITAGLGMSDDIIRVILQDLVSRLNSDKSIKERFLDNLKAAGEDNCAKLVAQ